MYVEFTQELGECERVQNISYLGSGRGKLHDGTCGAWVQLD